LRGKSVTILFALGRFRQGSLAGGLEVGGGRSDA
jgi:hypothetical protein